MVDAPSRDLPLADVFEPRALDHLGRCCGRKPLVYKRPKLRYFCCRCDAEYDENGQQRANWAWLKTGDVPGFVPRYPAQPYAMLVRASLSVQSQDGSSPLNNEPSNV